MRRMMLLTIWTAVAAFVLAAPLGARGGFPERIALPDNFRPEGIAIGKRGTFYVGSIPTGAIYRGNLKTGEGAVFIPGADGRAAIGVEFHRGLLFVAGGGTGKGFVYDAETGALLLERQLAADPITPNSTFVNDVVVARGGAYFTDSRRPFLYRLGSDGTVERIPLTGAIVYTPGVNNANGIDTTPNRKTLIIVQSNHPGKLFTVNRRTGVTREIALNTDVTNGDGILLDGRRTLYVVQNRDNKVAVIRLSRDLSSGTVVSYITDPDNFDVPTTIDEFGKRLYAVNARFRTPPAPPETEYWVSQFRKAKGRG